MKRLIILMCFISCIQLTVAQNYIHEFGKYSGEEFELQRYAKDPSAEAVVLYDIGQSYFTQTHNGFVLMFERRMKIKIFNKAGLKWAQISIPYYEENDKYEEISELKGNTYNLENGEIRVSALDPKKAYKEKNSKNWYRKMFAMPDVKEGSIIEISYKIKSPYLFNLRNWEFQNAIPVVYSEYTTKMNPFYEYTYLLQGRNKFDDFKSYTEEGNSQRFGTVEYKDMVYLFVMKDLPAFRDESFITSVNDYLVKLDFQLCVVHRLNGTKQDIMTTWPKLSDEMIDHSSFGKYLKSCTKKAEEFIDTMQLVSKSNLEKAKIIEHFVKSKFSWTGSSDKFATKSVKEFLTSKTGNSADINLFYAGMLNAAGIEAYPVIISTRSHGKLKLDYPFQSLFNYVLVFATVDSVSFLVDATEPFGNFSEIPTRCINDKGLIIQKNKVEWVSLKGNSVSTNVNYAKLVLNAAKDSVSQDCRLITRGYQAIDYRNRFSTANKKLKDELLSTNSSTSDSLKAIDLNQIEKPFEIDFTKVSPVETVEDKIIISPFTNFTITENPLKQPVRTYPVDFIYRIINAFESTIVIPEGYKLLAQPEGMRIDNDKVKILFSTTIQANNTIKVIGTYEFKKEEYAASEYADLKGYFNMIVEKFNEKLVLVKV